MNLKWSVGRRSTPNVHRFHLHAVTDLLSCSEGAIMHWENDWKKTHGITFRGISLWPVQTGGAIIVTNNSYLYDLLVHTDAFYSMSVFSVSCWYCSTLALSPGFKWTAGFHAQFHNCATLTVVQTQCFFNLILISSIAPPHACLTKINKSMKRAVSCSWRTS